MTSLDKQLDRFAEELPKAGSEEPETKPKRQSRKHVGAFSTGQPAPGEVILPLAPSVAAPHVYSAISAITHGLAQTGIGKTRRNMQQQYNFRGIDDVYNALAGLLVAHRLVILPHVEERTVSERAARGGGVLNYVTVHMSFDLISCIDGSRERVSSFGEAMDSGDKATNKALSTAYKYMAMQVFCIPTIGVDAEEDSYELTSLPGENGEVPATVSAPVKAAQPQPPVSDFDVPQLPAETAKEVIRAAVEKAGLGKDVFRPWYHTELNDAERLVLRPHIPQLKAIEEEATKMKKPQARKGAA